MNKKIIPGMKVKIKCIVKYGQDHRFLQGSFPDIIFRVVDILPNKMISLEAPNYGEHGNYGNGRIFLMSKYSENLFEVL